MTTLAAIDIEVRVQESDYQSLPDAVRETMQRCNGATGDGWMLIPRDGVLTFVFSVARWEQIKAMIEQPH